jgi:DNA polymerase elongation subunit (family B)
MINEFELYELLIFDLETAPEFSSFESLSKLNPRKADLWKTKHDKAKVKDPEKWISYDQSYIDNSSLSPEFARIVCASFIHLVETTEGITGRIKSFHDTHASDTSEVVQVLQPVAKMLENIGKLGKTYRLCGHNIKKFDIPFLSKRIAMSGMRIPSILSTWGKKPWEINHLDTGELWSMGAWDQYVSLDLLSESLGIPSPKENMKGEYVGKSFWLDSDYEKIRLYCEEDVKCVARIVKKLAYSPQEIIFE